MTALSLYLQVAFALVIGRFAWQLLRRLLLEREAGPSASLSSVLAHGLFAFVLALPFLLLAIPEPSPAPGDAATVTAETAATSSTESVAGFVLLGRSVSEAIPPELIQALPGLAAAILLPFVLVAAWRTGAQWLWLRRVVSRARPIRRVGRVRVLVSDEIGTPFSTAVLGRAHVVLPTALLDRRKDLHLVLRHELHHHRRRDVHWALALEVLRVLFHWNPAVHSWSRELSDWQERACDAELIERGAPLRAYAGCLLRVAEDSLPSLLPVASAAMARPNGRGALKRRIEMLLDPQTRSGRLGARGAALVLGAAVVLTTSAWAAAAALPNTNTAAVAAATTLVHAPSPQETALSIGSLAPDIKLADGRGKHTSLRDLRGQVVVIDFWAEWCRFCNEAVPPLRALEQELDNDELAIVGVSLDDTREAFDRFVSKHEVDWPQHHASGGMKGATANTYGVRALPLHVVIDREGRVAASGVVLAQLRPTIEALLNGEQVDSIR